jgi:ubiquinone/menaquinone biosynthesis C-methylase UbiE
MCVFVFFFRFLGLFVVALGVGHSDESCPVENHHKFIKDYHFPMVADDVRNELYFKALKKVILPNISRVLDVGSGTMLLSMMALELGAASIVGVEADVNMRQIAREVLEINNYSNEFASGKIQLFEGSFEQLKMDSQYVSVVS